MRIDSPMVFGRVFELCLHHLEQGSELRESIILIKALIVCEDSLNVGESVPGNDRGDKGYLKVGI